MKDWRQLKNYKDNVLDNSVFIRAETVFSRAVSFSVAIYSFFEYNKAKLPIATQDPALSSLNYNGNSSYSGNHDFKVQINQSIDLCKTLFIFNGYRHRVSKGNTNISVCHQSAHWN